LVAARTVRRNPIADSEPESNLLKPIYGSSSFRRGFLRRSVGSARSTITPYGEIWPLQAGAEPLAIAGLVDVANLKLISVIAS
jgi:hypothetical protein